MAKSDREERQQHRELIDQRNTMDGSFSSLEALWHCYWNWHWHWHRNILIGFLTESVWAAVKIVKSWSNRHHNHYNNDNDDYAYNNNKQKSNG